MDSERSEIMKELVACGLKVTPQRISVLETIRKSNDHPTAEAIHKEVLETIPGISATTIYNTLEIFVQKGLVNRVKTEADYMRYEPASEHHHHLYSTQSNKMQDYYDEELDNLLIEYFNKKKIKNFTIKEIKLQLMGDFNDQE